MEGVDPLNPSQHNPQAFSAGDIFNPNGPYNAFHGVNPVNQIQYNPQAFDTGNTFNFNGSMDQEPTSIETISSDELSDLSPRSEEEERSTPGQSNFASDENHEEILCQSETVDTEDSMDLFVALYGIMFMAIWRGWKR